MKIADKLNKTERVNKTGFKGVSMVRKGVYQSVITIRINNIQYTKHLGTYDTPGEAYVARVNYLKKLL
jgi:hypothetical protein